MGRYRNVTILAAAIFLQFLGLAIQIKRSTENESSRLIRVWAVSVVTPFEKGIIRVQGGASGIWHNYFYLRGVRQENRELRDQIEQLRLEQVRLKQDAEQARRLQALLGFKEQFIGKTTAAQVIGSSGSEQSRLVYIDKGSDDGIKNEMAVITADGVVGKVLNVVDGSTSQVLLINDQQSGVGAILEQSRLQGVLKGKASGEVIIDKIMSDEEVKFGDRVLTSGGDRIFPKGLPVGTVAKVSKGPEFLQITVKPAAVLSHLEEVLVITKKAEHEESVSSGASVRAADILAQRLPSVPDKPQPVSPAPTVTGSQVKPQTASPLQSGTTGPVPPPKTQASATGTSVQPKPQLNPTGMPVKAQVPTATMAGPAKPTVVTSQESKPAAAKPSAPPVSKPAGNATQAPSNAPPDTSGDTPQ